MHLAEFPALLALALAGIGALGHSYDAEALYRISPYSSRAVQTAICFVLLSVGVLFAPPSRGFLSPMIDVSAGGVMARQILPVALSFMLVGDWLRLAGERAGWYERGFGLALGTAGNAGLLTSLIWWSARSLNRSDVERRHNESEVRKTAADLHRTNERLEAAEARARMGNYELDLTTGAMVWSRQMFALFGLGEGDPPSLHRFLEFIHPEDRAVISSMNERLRNGESKPVGEFRTNPESGGVRHLEVRCEAIRDAAGRATRAAGVLIDYTERKQFEEALRHRTAALERSKRALEQFANIASHDLQEPLRGVSGCVQLLAQNYGDGLDERARQWISLAVSNTQRMRDLILAVLEYARVESAGESFELVDAGAVFRQSMGALATAIQETGAEITSEGLGVVRADRVQLGQLLQNLVGNALKFHGESPPRVHVKCIPVETAANESNGHPGWQFEVSDNGVGIDPKHAERIFNVFQRLHPMRKYPGTGIGLAICKRVVERHGGRIWVESQAGQGSTFKFTLANTGPGDSGHR